MKFAILQSDSAKALEYNHEQFVSRLKARVRENLVASEGFFKRSWNVEEINDSIDKAFNDLGAEFDEVVGG